MKKKANTLLFLAPLLAIICLSFEAFTTKKYNQTGQNLYKLYCASCHGVNGNGKGEMAYLVYPKPRDFIAGKFKIKSTLPGMPPQNKDIFMSIQKGMPGTAMQSFNFLNDQEIDSLVKVVKEFSGMNNDNVPVIKIPDEVPISEDLIILGKSVYNKTGCHMCHGSNGKGDGPSSNQLIDTQGFPSVPKDFTSGVYLGGGDKRDLYYRFVGGMDGTPMPSFGNLSELLGRPISEESKLAWSLVHYVKSLENQKIVKTNTPPDDDIIQAIKIEDFISEHEIKDYLNIIWETKPSYSIPISRLWQSENINYQILDIQAIYNTNFIAIKMEWEDSTKDQEVSKVQNFQDGAAIQFSINGTKGFHGMGSENHPTDIWFWKAEWQKRIDHNIEADITLAYIDRVSDSDIESFPEQMNDIAYLAGRDAGNLNASSSQSSSVENVTAIGPKTVTPFQKHNQKVLGKGIWDGKKWRVVFVRKLKSELDKKVNFEAGAIIPIGFAIWNGNERDRNGQKMVSTWFDLELKDLR